MRSCPTFGYRVVHLMAALLLLVATASAQSLGEVARRLRVKKRPQAKATRVYTNEDLPTRGGLSTGVAAEAKPKQDETTRRANKLLPRGKKRSPGRKSRKNTGRKPPS